MDISKIGFDLEHRDKLITVTSPLLPDLSELVKSLEQIWKYKWLTNCGPFHQKLEVELCEYLKV